MFPFFGKKKSSTAEGEICLELMNELQLLYGQSIKELNHDLANESAVSLQVVEKQSGKSESAKADFSRFTVYNTSRCLTIRGCDSKVEIFLLPRIDLDRVPESEYASRRRFKFEMVRGEQGQCWTLDNAPLEESSLRLAVLATLNDLLRDAAQPIAGKADDIKLKVGGASLSTAVRELMTDKERLIASLVGQQEAIFKRVARDLHDCAIGDLMVLLRGLESEHLSTDEIRAAIEHSVQGLRDVCDDLSSRELNDWGLRDAVQELCGRFSRRSGIAIEFDAAEREPIFPSEIDLQIYRIIQESLNNAIKYSGAKKVSVAFSWTESEFTTEIIDDGTGIQNKSESRHGAGLRILKERAELISSQGLTASLSIDSVPGRGMAICLRIKL